MNPDKYVRISSTNDIELIKEKINIDSSIAEFNLVIDEDGSVQALSLVKDNYYCKKSNNDVICKKSVQYNPGDIIYYNVTTGSMCNKNEASISTGNSGCMRFYVVTLNDTAINDKIEVILDHNTTNKTSYYESNQTYTNIDTRFNYIEQILDSETSNWIIDDRRILTTQDVINITNISSLESQYSEEYSWLSINTEQCTQSICNISVGYWLDLERDSEIAPMIYVLKYNNLMEQSDGTWINDSFPVGIRPVITINK